MVPRFKFPAEEQPAHILSPDAVVRSSSYAVRVVQASQPRVRWQWPARFGVWRVGDRACQLPLAVGPKTWCWTLPEALLLGALARSSPPPLSLVFLRRSCACVTCDL